MAVGGPEPEWDVIIEYGDASMKRLYSLPVSTTVDEIMRKWLDDVEIEAKNGALVTCEGSRMEGDKLLKEIAEIAPGLGIVRLCFFEEEDIPVGVYGGLYASPKFRARLSQPPGRLFPEIRRLFHAADEQDFRIWSHRGLLEKNVPLAAQGISENTPLFVEIALDLEFHDPWDKITVQLENVFASDNCQEVLKVALASINAQRQLDNDTLDGLVIECKDSKACANGVKGAEGIASDDRKVAASEEDCGFDDCFEEIEFEFDLDDCVPKKTSQINEKDFDIGKVIDFQSSCRIDCEDVSDDSTDDYQSVEALPLDQLEILRTPSTIEVENLRIRLGEQEVHFSGEVLDSLSAFGAPWLRFFSLQMESERLVATVSKKSVEMRGFWPSDRVSQISDSVMFYGGLQLHGEDKFADLNLPEFGVLTEAPISLKLVLTSGKCSIMRVPIIATVGDIRQSACDLEDRKYVLLRGNGKILESDELCLWQVGIDSDTEIGVELNSLEMSVRIHDNEIAWRPEYPKVSYSNIVTEILSHTNIPYWELRDMIFCCVGCKRKICRQNQSLLSIPSKCCPIQSCLMELWTPPKIERRNSAEMAKLWALKVRIKELEEENSKLLARTRKKSTKLGMCRKKIEKLLTENFTLQADNAFLEGQVQELHSFSSKMKSSKSSLEVRLQELQQQLSSMQLRQFRIVNWCSDFNGGDNFDVELNLSRSPTVGEVRTAVATHMGRSPTKTKLRRDVGICDGHLVFDVGPEEKFVYADASGNIRDDATVINKRRERLVKDNEVLTIVPGRRNSLWVLGR